MNRQKITRYILQLESLNRITTNSGTVFIFIILCTYCFLAHKDLKPGTPTNTAPRVQPRTVPGTLVETQPGTKLNKGNKENNIYYYKITLT